MTIPGFVGVAAATGLPPAFINGQAAAGADGKLAIIDAGESEVFLDGRTEAA